MNRTWVALQAALDTDAATRSETLAAEARFRDLKPEVTSRRIRNKPIRSEDLDQITSVTLSFRNMHEYGALLTNYLEVRKSIFLDDLGWHVSEADGMEFDQYDNPFARWIILHQWGEILGSVRMLPTTARCGLYSYMLRDAQRGILEDLPTDVLFFPAPVEHNVWEATRFFITDAVPADKRQDIQALLFRAMCRTAMENGASHILGIVPSMWARWARRLKIEATPIGAKFSIEGTVSQSVLFEARNFVV